ncbi:hypothetical protein NLX67_18390 [Domibacillus sp. A3M-37]|uniref:DoxX family protein n=1 Tax=Domibacillus TaxID=1433999 RepID=UPI000617F52B|nr:MULTISPECIES: membrane protein [Domibacillus]MCP3764320.1 hypothetical protein [Domibacillus sp. A3M-37]
MKTILRLLYGAGFLFAGIAHFTRSKGFEAIVPAFLPFKKAIVAISGVIEILYGVVLLLDRRTSFVTKTIPGFLAAVFPANVYMAAKNIPLGNKQLPKWALWGRLPLQWLLIKGAKNIDQ